MGLVDGPTEVHKSVLAREVLKAYKPADEVWPTGHLPAVREAARRHLTARIDQEVAEL
ncbi:MAG: hypothetical protein U5K30_14020 [Acidimicrobiales bacterium]|nr:hypothetical protein [Acidimicrobiales bacterium]